MGYKKMPGIAPGIFVSEPLFVGARLAREDGGTVNIDIA
jgi:hypothetical protein